MTNEDEAENAVQSRWKLKGWVGGRRRGMNEREEKGGERLPCCTKGRGKVKEMNERERRGAK